MPYYGEAAGDRLTELLKEHILIAVDLVEAAKTRRQRRLRDARRPLDGEHPRDRRLPGRGEPELARGGGLRPPRAPSPADEGRGRRPAPADWDADVKAFDDIFTEILVVADTLHDGLAAQFPDRFAPVAAAA